MSIRLITTDAADGLVDPSQSVNMLLANLQNPWIDEITILTSRSGSQHSGPTSSKVRYLNTAEPGNRVLGNLFSEANRSLAAPNDVSIISPRNALFDESLAELASIHFRNFCLALISGHLPSTSGPQQSVANLAALVFQGRIRPHLSQPQLIDKLNVTGLVEDLRRADYHVVNPAKSIRCSHRFTTDVAPPNCSAESHLTPMTIRESGIGLLPPQEQGVIAYSLYGSAPRYRHGAIENAKAIKWLYPGWLARFYVDSSIPQELLHRLHELNAEVIVMPDSHDKQGMFWRFLVADDPGFTRWMVRDADSRLTYRERRAVDEWIDSGRPFHVMRDHPRHRTAIVGCAFGGLRGGLPNMTQLMASWRASGQPFGSYGDDEKFLEAIVWPLIKEVALVHDSSTTECSENVRPFPCERENFRFVGERIGADDHASYPERHALIQAQLERWKDTRKCEER